jgi:hopene-associated glycosyltransferase HpnB
VSLALAALALAAWIYLLLGRGFFWLPRSLEAAAAPQRWPAVVAIVPARNEAAHVGKAIASLLAQRYPGPFSLVLVDDHSSDGTAAAARRAAQRGNGVGRLGIVAARDLPPRWSGKLWALAEGVRHAEEGSPPDLYLFTDADIAHAPDNLRRLVAAMEAQRRDLVSLMVRLNTESAAERLLVPAFVFFFAMLYPFAWVGDTRRRTAAAAGGCILVRREAYRRSGGFEAIRGELIDDCALARQVKRGGPIALALTCDTASLRPYPRLKDVWEMVARTAYTQLGHSPLLLGATALGLGVVYLAPPALLMAGAPARWLGLAAWASMSFAYAPMLRFYGLSPLRAPLLPAVAAIYLGATVASAVRHYRGRGGMWKGRVQWQSQR